MSKNNFTMCTECKEYHWDNKKCKPAYFVYHEDYMGDEAKIVRASNHDDAALAYAQYYNQDYELMDTEIDVKVEKDGVVKFFTVGAEPDIHYSSTEIESLKN